MPGKFVIKKGSTGKFRFSLLSTNGRVVATSEAYNSKASAMGGIRSVKSLAADAAIEDQTTKEWVDGEAARSASGAVKRAASTAKKVVKKVPGSLNPNPPIRLGRPTRRPGSVSRWTTRANGGSKASRGR